MTCEVCWFWSKNLNVHEAAFEQNKMLNGTLLYICETLISNYSDHKNQRFAQTEVNEVGYYAAIHFFLYRKKNLRGIINKNTRSLAMFVWPYSKGN